jgi:hypothetical protein
MLLKRILSQAEDLFPARFFTSSGPATQNQCSGEKESILMKTKIRNSISGLLLIPLVVACFALLPKVQAAPDPAPPPGANTRDGAGAMAHVTTGQFNTAFGTNALNTLTTGNNNSAQGNSALFTNNGSQNVGVGNLTLRLNTTGSQNVAVGANALTSNVTGSKNTALGQSALTSNTSSDNVAVGFSALFHNTSVSPNVAVGSQALQSNTFGGFNTATGTQALFLNVDGEDNTAVGNVALGTNIHGNSNTAVGSGALISATGSNNIAVGSGAGGSVTSGSNNIDIGNIGAAESNTIRIGVEAMGGQTATFIAGIFGRNVSAATDTPVIIDSTGKLGTATSSQRFKKDIKPMDKASEAILVLKPVTFHYKSDPSGFPRFGLVAEDVAKVSPDLIVRDADGQILSVRYEAVNAMLLNEFLKEHKKVEELEATVASLATALKEQAVQIQKVSAQLEVNKPAPRTVARE